MWILGILARLGKFARTARLYLKKTRMEHVTTNKNSITVYNNKTYIFPLLSPDICGLIQGSNLQLQLALGP